MTCDERTSVASLVLARSTAVLAGLWTRPDPPVMVGRLRENGTMAEAGAAALVMRALTPEGTAWAIVPFETFSGEGGGAMITDRTTWHATESGHAVPHSIETVPSFRLQEWEASMTRVHPPSSGSDEQ